MVNEPSVFKPFMFYCIFYFSYHKRFISVFSIFLMFVGISGRVATYHSPQNSLTCPDFSLTLYSFQYLLKDKKILFFSSLMVLTVSLLIQGLLLKERISQGSKFFPIRVAPNGEGDGLRLSHEKVHLYPS